LTRNFDAKFVAVALCLMASDKYFNVQPCEKLLNYSAWFMFYTCNTNRLHCDLLKMFSQYKLESLSTKHSQKTARIKNCVVQSNEVKNLPSPVDKSV